MSSSNTKETSKKASRREIIRLGGLAVATAATLRAVPAAAIEAPPIPQDAATCCGTQPLPAQSVFTTACNDVSAIKYASGDNAATYRLGALWLLLTTEDWSTYFRNGTTEDQWIAGLSTELQLPLTDVTNLWNESKTAAPHFQAIRAFWQNYTAADSALYGKRPCIGGKTALDIACLAGTASVRMKKTSR
jgi:hypothetical protein